jgi:hypothetical protein
MSQELNLKMEYPTMSSAESFSFFGTLCDPAWNISLNIFDAIEISL